MACAVSKTSSVIVDFREKMLKEHTLDAVFSFPDEMFYPGASSVVCCMVFNLGKPHPSDYETFFGYFKEDGFEKKKNIGRVDIHEQWDSIEKEWLDLYFHRTTKKGRSVTYHVNGSDEWCAEAYMETDYSDVNENVFNTKIREYAAHKIASSPLNVFSQSIETTEWRWFRFDEIFIIKKGFYNKRPPHVPNGDIPFIGATDSNNGITSMCDLESIEISSKTGNENNAPLSEKLFEPNCITVSNNGSVGFAFYQDRLFTCSHDVNPLYLKHHILNKYIAMFLCAVIEKERYRWAYGRKWRPSRMPESLLKLPIKNDGTPDWTYMENFIKSLPFSAKI